jgi:hypothetical protein
VDTGFDGTQEELYSQCVVAALQREYKYVTSEGPGQGKVILNKEFLLGKKSSNTSYRLRLELR